MINNIHIIKDISYLFATQEEDNEWHEKALKTINYLEISLNSNQFTNDKKIKELTDVIAMQQKMIKIEQRENRELRKKYENQSDDKSLILTELEFAEKKIAALKDKIREFGNDEINAILEASEGAKEVEF